jgi:hypothetical protein
MRSAAFGAWWIAGAVACGTAVAPGPRCIKALCERLGSRRGCLGFMQT